MSHCVCHITQPTFLSVTEFRSNKEGKNTKYFKEKDTISLGIVIYFPQLGLLGQHNKEKMFPWL